MIEQCFKFDGVFHVFKGSSSDFQYNNKYFDVENHSVIVQATFLKNYSTICISFIKYVMFPCFDIFWFISLIYTCLSILELKGWRSPPSKRKFLQLNVAEDQLDFPGICSFLRSSLGLETLVIDWFGDSPRLSFGLFLEF